MSDAILSAEELAKWTPKIGTPKWVHKIVRSHEALRAERDEARREAADWKQRWETALEVGDEDALTRWQQRARIEALTEVLEFYADPGVYHAVAFFFDPPGGGWAEDFDEDHGDEFYDRPMPGKLARKALAEVRGE